MWKFGAFASLALFIGVAVPQQSQAQGSRVSVLGCVSPGVEGGCLIITDNVSGKVYQINAAEPKPDPAKRLVVRLVELHENAMQSSKIWCRQITEKLFRRTTIRFSAVHAASLRRV